MTAVPALLLSEADVARCLDQASLIPLMRETLAAFSAGTAAQPVRTNMEIAPAGGFYGVMPAYVPGARAFGLKSVTFFPSNEGTSVPTHLAAILLHDPATGALTGIVDGRLVTEMRTAAVSAVSVDLLARKDARRLAILGSGVQARSHLEALVRVRRLEDVCVWSRTPARAQAFTRDAAALVPSAIRTAASVQAAVDGADIVVTVTSAREPILRAAWLSPGTHLCVVGSSHPRMREVDSETVVQGRVFVDSRAAAAVEAGDLLIPVAEGRWSLDRIAGELGEVAGGALGRRGADEITLFKSLGLGVEDVASAALALERARERGLGTPIRLQA